MRFAIAGERELGRTVGIGAEVAFEEFAVRADDRSPRMQRKLSQESLAEAARLSRNYISDIEGGVRNPSLLAFVALSRALRSPLREMLADVEPR